MKHYTKQQTLIRSVPVFQLIDDEGDTVPAFDAFAEALVSRGYALATIKRYLEVGAAFVDYLTEAKVFGQAATTLEVNQAIDRYFSVIARATEIRSAPQPISDDFIRWARPIADALDLHSVIVAANTVAAVNRFLKQSKLAYQVDLDLAKEARLPELPPDLKSAFGAISAHVGLSLLQKKALKQNSMLANVIRLHPDGLERPRNLPSPRSRKRMDDDSKDPDFPLNGIAPLLEAASSKRDYALWALLVGGGLRMSEALSLKWEHIDAEARRVFIDDPAFDRSRPDEPSYVPVRFKGRAVAEVYLFEPVKTRFLEALADYLREEYVPGCGHSLVFQDIRPGDDRGRPMHLFSDAARVKAFQRAVRRAGVAPPRSGQWSPHSLRHTYGVYMRNYIPVPGGFGLELEEVQRLMGHRDPRTTDHYAREKRIILDSKLAWSDQYVTERGTHVASLPTFVMKRLRHEADRIEEGLA